MAEQHQPKPIDTHIDTSKTGDMSGGEVYQRMREEAAGTKKLREGTAAAGVLHGKLKEAEDTLRKYQQTLASGLHGDGGDAAHEAMKPLLDRVTTHQTDLESYKTLSNNQAGQFETYSGQLEKIPHSPPGFFDRLGHSVNPFSESDPSNDTAEWHRANATNKATFQSYGIQTNGSAGSLPGESPSSVNTFANTEIYNPNRTPGHDGGSDGKQPRNDPNPDPGPGPGDTGPSNHRGPGHVNPPPGKDPNSPNPHQPSPHSGGHGPAGQPDQGSGGHSLPPGQLATASEAGPGGGSSSFGHGPGGAGGYGGTGGRSGGAELGGLGAGAGLGGYGGGFGGGDQAAGRGGFGSGRFGSGGQGAGRGGAGAGGGSGEGGPGRGGSTGAGPRSGAAGAAESAGAGRGGAAGGAGTRGPAGMPMGGRGGSKQQDEEHETPSYLITEEHGNEIVGDLPPTAPPVIGA